jgi:mycofactocin glycosyltransferase
LAKSTAAQTMAYPIFGGPLVPTQLKGLWSEVEAGHLTKQEFADRQEVLISQYVEIWSDALRLPGESDLTRSLCLELADLTGCADLEVVKARCLDAVNAMRDEWHEVVSEEDETTIEEYYDKSRNYAYELMWWHTLEEDRSPLAYVCALHLASQNGCRFFLDFGAGTGSGGLLFSRHGAAVTLADISSTLLDFSRRRLVGRGIDACFIGLKSESLPENACDFIAAMDVFEHLSEPEKTVEMLAKSLQPGGILFGRFAAEEDANRPSHIARDFQPTFDRLAGLGFTEIWRDEWLWGHQAFRKAPA